MRKLLSLACCFFALSSFAADHSATVSAEESALLQHPRFATALAELRAKVEKQGYARIEFTGLNTLHIGAQTYAYVGLQTVRKGGEAKIYGSLVGHIKSAEDESPVVDSVYFSPVVEPPFPPTPPLE